MRLPTLYLFGRLFAAMWCLWAVCGCSSAIRSRGPNVFRFSATETPYFTRDEVLRNLGTTESSIRFRNTRTVGSLKAQLHPAFEYCKCKDSLRVALVERHVFKGPVFDSGAFKDSYAMAVFASFTLGLSELVFFPIAVGDAISRRGDLHHFYTVYNAGGMLVWSRLIKVK